MELKSRIRYHMAFWFFNSDSVVTCSLIDQMLFGGVIACNFAIISFSFVIISFSFGIITPKVPWIYVPIRLLQPVYYGLK